MAGNKRPRKAYRPKKILLNPMQYLQESFTLLSEHDGYAMIWKSKANLAMQLLTRGQATRADMDTLMAAHNVTEALTITTKAPASFEETIIRSRVALVDVCTRGNQTGRCVLKAPEMQAINDMLQLHDEFMDNITVQQMEQALAFSKSEMRKGHVHRVPEPVVKQEALEALMP